MAALRFQFERDLEWLVETRTWDQLPSDGAMPRGWYEALAGRVMAQVPKAIPRWDRSDTEELKIMSSVWRRRHLKANPYQ